MKVVIIGGVAGEQALRRASGDWTNQPRLSSLSVQVTYLMPIAACHIILEGVIQNRELLTLQTPQSFNRRFAIDVRVHHEVTAIHRERKAVTVQNLETGAEFEETYDKLVLSPGRAAHSSAHAWLGCKAPVYATHGGGHPADP